MLEKMSEIPLMEQKKCGADIEIELKNKCGNIFMQTYFQLE